VSVASRVAAVRELEGVVVATLTPFDEQGKLDVDAIAPIVELHVAAGVSGIMVCGTTGEFLTMTPDERRITAEAFLSAIGGRVTTIVNVSHLDRRIARELAEHAASIGTTGVSALTPYFHPVTPGATVAMHRELASAVPETAYQLYHFPRNSTNPFTGEQLEALLSVENLAGIKASVDSLNELEVFLRYEPRVRVLAGNDSLMPAFATLGGQAIISGNAAAFPEIVVGAWNAIKAGEDLAGIRPILEDLAISSRAGAPDQLKVTLRERGLPGGWARIQSYDPQVPDALAAGVRAATDRLLQKVG